MTTPQQRVFITGGASGLGLALAKYWGMQGARVCIADINSEMAKQAAKELRALGIHTHVMMCDVTQIEALQNAARELQRLWGGVDVVINNAGVATAGSFDKEDMPTWEWVLNINLLGVVRGCQAFVDIFRAQGHGQFINIASQAGLTPIAKMASYNATKAAVVSFSETLRTELADDNIRVSVACPAFFKTNLHKSLRTSEPVFAEVTEKLLERGSISANQVAEMIFNGVKRNEFIITTHSQGRTVWLLKRLLPNRMYMKLMAKRTEKMRQVKQH